MTVNDAEITHSITAAALQLWWVSLMEQVNTALGHWQADTHLSFCPSQLVRTGASASMWEGQWHTFVVLSQDYVCSLYSTIEG